MAAADCSTLSTPSLLTDPVVEMETDSAKVVVEEATPTVVEEEEDDKPVRMTRPRGSSRVHFPEDVHDPEIHVSREINSTIDVNLGFLQSSHRYRASFSVADTIKGDINIPLPEQTTGVVNAEAHPTQNGEGHDIILQLIHHRDGVLSEDLELVSQSEPSRIVKLVLHCRLINPGKDQGTPQVKEGIQTLGIEADPAAEESEGSDWTPYE